MNRNLMRRVAKLEHRMSTRWEEIQLTFADGRIGNLGSRLENFYELADMVCGQPRDAERAAISMLRLHSLCHATKLEGPNSQMFGLLRSLALGPAGGLKPEEKNFGTDK